MDLYASIFHLFAIYALYPGLAVQCTRTMQNKVPDIAE